MSSHSSIFLASRFFMGDRQALKIFGIFIKSASENPVLWTGMKDVSAESRKKQTRC
jgi:hypothetical protein